MKIIAIIVAYRPDVYELRRNVEFILPQVDYLYIVDNTEGFSYLSSHFSHEKISILPLLENFGIAHALNIGTNEAIKKGADWILSFDQDSCPSMDYVRSFAKILNRDEGSIGQIGPLYTMKNRKKNTSESVQICDELITSGAFIRKEVFEAVGGYKEELFIDSVDTEISWNIRAHGYSVCVVNDIILQHNLGSNARDISVFGKRIMTITNHSPLRYYYMCRNAYYISDLYRSKLGKSAQRYRYKGVKLILKVLLFESDKINKIKSIIKGYIDYKNKIMGKKV